jgi:hypothetical protein
MVSDIPPFRITVDRSEFDEAIAMIQARYDSLQGRERLRFEAALANIQNGLIPDDRLRVAWQEKDGPARDVLHIVPGPALLDLALPAAEVAVCAPTRLGFRERLRRAVVEFRRRY